MYAQDIGCGSWTTDASHHSCQSLEEEVYTDLLAVLAAACRVCVDEGER
jgi:hypothetical protein